MEHPDTERKAYRRGSSVIHAAPLLVGLLLALRASEAIRDNSFLWHIRAGSIQLAAERVISADPFSFTAAGEPWRTQSWLVELAYAGLESVTPSLSWANWFVFGVGAVILALIGLAMYDRNRSPIIVTLGLLVAVWLFAPFAQARPVIVSYVFMGVVVLVVRRKDALLWILVPLFWVWAGVHGSWALGGALIVLELVRSRDLRLLKVGFVSLAFTVLTAHGLGTWLILYDFARAGDALSLIAEWQPPNFGGIAQAPYLIVIVGLFIGFARGHLKMRDLVVIVPFLFYGMTSERAVFPAAIVLLPFAVAGIPSPTLIRSATAKPVVWSTMVLIGGMALLPMLVRPLGVLDAERFPNEAVVASIDGRAVFHDTAVGGYLIYTAWPDDAVYIDDRAELYGFSRLEEFIRAQSGDYVDVFERYGIEIAIVEPDSPLERRLTADGWVVEVASDEFLTMVEAPAGS